MMRSVFLLIIISLIFSIGGFSQIYTIKPEITSPPTPAAPDVPSNIAIGSKVTFRAENYILLKQGFYSANGSNFYAHIGGPISHGELKSELDGSYHTTINNKIYFTYEEIYSQPEAGAPLDYKIYNSNMTVLSTASVTRFYGINYLNIDVRGVSGLTSNAENYYILEVSNDKGEKKYLRFKHIAE